MAGYQLRELRSLDQLRQCAAAWDDLWRRSDVTVPVTRAEMVAQWCEQFAPQQRFRAFTVERDGQLVAAIPLVGQRLAPGIELGGLANDPWSLCGDLLVDPSASEPELFTALLGGMQRAPWPFLRLAPIPLETPRWTALCQAARELGWRLDAHEHYRVGTVEIGHDWDRYEADMSGNHRRYLRKARRRAESGGNVGLRMLRHVPADDIAVWLRRGFAIEDRGWKGAAGTSVIRTPGMFDYYWRQATQLAVWGQLQLMYLELNGEPIAFEYGWIAKRTYFSPKVGYDERYAALSPGQVLRDAYLRQFHAGDEVDLLDFWGPLAEATSRWVSSSYPVSRLALVPPRLTARLAFFGYLGATRLADALRKKPSSTEHIEEEQAEPKRVEASTEVEPTPRAVSPRPVEAPRPGPARSKPAEHEPRQPEQPTLVR